MPQENLGALRALYEEWARGNFRAGVKLLDRDVVFILPQDFPDAGT